MTLRLKFVVLVVIPLAVIFTVLAILQFNAMREAAVQSARQHVQMLAQSTAQQIEGALARAVHVAHTGAAALTEADEIRGDRVWRLLERLVDRVPLVSGAALAWAPDHVPSGDPASPYVHVLNGAIQRTDLNQAYTSQGGSPYWKRMWYRVAADGNADWTPPYFGPVFDGLLVSYSVPIIRNDEVAGVLSLDVPLVPLQQELHIKDFPDAIGYLVGPGDRFISNPDPDLIMKSVHQTGAPSALADAPPGTLLDVPDWPNHSPHIVAIEPIPTADWVFAAALGQRDVVGPVWRQLSINIGILLAGGVVMSIIVLATGLRLTGDVRRLSEAVGRVSRGDLGAEVERIRRRDELGTLAHDFNAMTQRLAETVQEAAEEQSARQAVERELDLARDIQNQLIPHENPMLPDHPSVDLHAMIVPARHVAGDFFDYWVADRTLTVVLADVAGSGMPASLVMVRAVTLLRQFDSMTRSLSDLLAQTNAALCQWNERQIFVTAVVIRFDLDTGAYELVNAGHLPPLICSKDTVTEEGDSTGPLLGVIPDATFETRSGHLEPGHWIGLYTDGITEARSPDGDMFGSNRLIDTMNTHREDSAESLCNTGIKAAEAWHGGPVNDDLSMLILRWAASGSNEA